MLFADTCHRHGLECYIERGITRGAVQLLGSRLWPDPEFPLATGALYLDFVRLLSDPEDT